MAKINETRMISKSPCSLRTRSGKVLKDSHHKKCSKSQEKKEWKRATCSVCMEHPHNTVLLLCSSYNKGCRPYMCATGTRFSNCLEQHKKAYTKLSSIQDTEPLDTPSYDPDFGIGCFNEKTEKCELLCPLCRGQVKGWTVVEPARKYLNTKKRTCTQDKCSFIGTYKELKKHVKEEHPWARPREVDPSRAEKWTRLEREREQQDVISTIRSSMPGALVIGDYVIERPVHIFSNHRGNSGYLSWDDEGEMDLESDLPVLGIVDNYFLSRLSRFNRPSSGGMRSRRRRSYNRG